MLLQGGMVEDVALSNAASGCLYNPARLCQSSQLVIAWLSVSPWLRAAHAAVVGDAGGLSVYPGDMATAG